MSNIFSNIKDRLDDPIVRHIISASLFDTSLEGLRKWTARMRGSDDKQVYGWVENNELIGVCAFLPHPEKVEIFNITTAENSRRRGVGGAMVKALQSMYRLPIEAETDGDAVGFYRKCGFETAELYKQYGSETVRRWTCVLPIPGCSPQETDEERRARIYPIILSEYNPAWPEWFAEEKANLERLLGDNIVSIQHIGSTAVPGLMAKPTIDILLEIKESADIDKLIAALPPLDYICLRGAGLTIPTPPPHLRFIKGYLPDGFAEKVYHIHVVYPGDEDSRNKLIFRDYLFTHTEAAAEYAALKRSLSRDYEHDRDGYTDAKGAFIQRITEKARTCDMTHRFTDVCFITNDVMRLRAFYEAVFDAKAEGDEIHSGISIDGLTLVFDHVDIADENPAFRYIEAGCANNVIVGFNVDDVDAEYNRLLPLGAEMLNEPTTHPWGGAVVPVPRPGR